jgi:hypothetical protein
MMTESKVDVKISSNAMNSLESHVEIQKQHLRSCPELVPLESHVEIQKQHLRSYPELVPLESHVEIQKQHLRSYPQLVLCPNCSKVGFSRVERSCHRKNFLFSCCFFWCWAGFMLYKWKDMNFCNAKHTCTGCGEVIAEYDACGSIFVRDPAYIPIYI